MYSVPIGLSRESNKFVGQVFLVKEKDMIFPVLSFLFKLSDRIDPQYETAKN